MPVQSAFTLNANEIFASIANMIISQEVFADNLGKHQTLVDKARVDGGLYGDKKLYYATDVLKTVAWGADTEAANLLALDRPADPEVQDITLNVFRQIRLTVDDYLTKRAWSSATAFSDFNSVMLGWMRETKKVYDGTHYNVFIGTTSSAQADKTISLVSGKEGQSIAQGIADLLVEMSDYSREFNDYGFLRSYSPDEVKVIWNAKYVNEIKKVDIPTIFHKDGLVDKLDDEIMPARYFGRPLTSDDVGANKIIKADGTYDASKGTLRLKIEETQTPAGGAAQNMFPGDKVVDGAEVGTDVDALNESYYIEDADIIAKVVVKLPPYMSAFEVATSFFNPRSLTENHYLTFGHNTLEYLKNYPFITVKKS